MVPFDLHGLKTYDLKSRPSKVFHEDLGQPVDAGPSVADWLDSLPRLLAATDIRAVRDHLCRAHEQGRTVVAAMGGHVIKTGCGPYFIDWIQRGLLSAVALNGAAAIHDFELAVAGKTSEDVAAQLPTGQFGMARETADAFAVAARAGAEKDRGLGAPWASTWRSCASPHGDSSVMLAAYRAGIPCTIHVAIGTDIVHMHPHVSGRCPGRSVSDRFPPALYGGRHSPGRRVAQPRQRGDPAGGFVKAVSVVRNFGHNLDGLVAVNVDKQSQYRSRVNVLDRPAAHGIELIGHHEILLPLLHAASRRPAEIRRPRRTQKQREPQRKKAKVKSQK